MLQNNSENIAQTDVYIYVTLNYAFILRFMKLRPPKKKITVSIYTVESNTSVS